MFSKVALHVIKSGVLLMQKRHFPRQKRHFSGVTVARLCFESVAYLCQEPRLPNSRASLGTFKSSDNVITKTIMQMKRLLIVCLLAVVALLPCAAQNQLKKVYNEDINPLVQIDDALRKAGSDGKNVVCQLGGNWCVWCLRFADFVENDSVVSELVNDNFVFIHVNYNPRKSIDESKKEQTATMLKRLGNPVRFGFPVLVVLDPQGNVLHTQDSSFLEENKGYNRERVLRFLRNWTPKAVSGARM